GDCCCAACEAAAAPLRFPPAGRWPGARLRFAKKRRRKTGRHTPQAGHRKTTRVLACKAPPARCGPAGPAAHGQARRAGAIQKKAVTMGEYQSKEWKTWSSISIYSGREFQ